MKRVGIITAVVVALVAATLAGLWWGHHTTTRSTTPTPTTSKATTPASQLAAGTVVAGEGGTLPGPGTLKLGYAHTPDGAVAAITNYVMAANDKTNLASPAYRTALVNAIALDDASKTGITSVVDLIANNCAHYGDCRLEPRRGSYAIRAYADDRAEVALWVPYYLAQPVGTYMAGSFWGISTYALTWNGSDWKVASLAGDLITDDSTVDLPLLANREGNPTRAEKAAVLTTPRGGTARLWALSWTEYANAVR